MKTRHIVILGAVGAVAALVAVPFLLPLDTYRAPIERAASSALGREVHIRGSLGLSVYPQIGISLCDVSIANAPGARHPQMVEVGIGRRRRQADAAAVPPARDHGSDRSRTR